MAKPVIVVAMDPNQAMPWKVRFWPLSTDFTVIPPAKPGSLTGAPQDRV
jgi:hypothetical protein